MTSPLFLRVTVLVLGLLGCALSPCAGQRPRSQSSGKAGSVLAADRVALDRALADYDAGRTAGATPVLLELARRYPEIAEVQAAAGIALAEADKVAAAIPLLARAHQLDRANPTYEANLAAAYVHAGRSAEALGMLRSACAREPENVDAWLTLAQAESATGDLHGATRSFQTAAEQMQRTGKPVPADVAHDWSVALLNDGRPAEAAALLRREPGVGDDAPNLTLRAEAEEKNRDFEAAVADFKRAAEIEPSEENLYRYGDEMLRHWTFPAAIKILSYASERYPESGRIRTALGIADFGNGAFSEAARVLRLQLQRAPDDVRVADLLGRSCAAEMGNEDASCAGLPAFAKAHPENAPIALYAAIMLAHRPDAGKDAMLAKQLLEGALRADPKLAEAWYELAGLDQASGQWTESVDPLRRAIALRPEYAEAHYKLSRAYAHLQQRDEAAEQIALQQKYARAASEAEKQRMQEVMTFLTTTN